MRKAETASKKLLLVVGLIPVVALGIGAVATHLETPQAPPPVRPRCTAQDRIEPVAPPVEPAPCISCAPSF